MKSFISLEEALEIIDNNINHLQIEEVDLLNAINKVLAEDIYSLINNPPFAKSAMDGYAIKHDGESRLKVIDEIYAGQCSCKEVEDNTAIRIMTGAPIPKGADAVIKQEDVECNENMIVFNKQLKINENICPEGEDIKIGTLLAVKGKKLNYADIGIIASSGINTVKVYKTPGIALITTGDEVVEINEGLAPGKIYNSNKYSLLARINELGFNAGYVNHINDEYTVIGDEIKKISEKVDLIITTGGASVGKKDLVKEAIDYIGGEKLFWKIKIKPGSSVLAAKYNNTLILCLSGNPTAALTTFELLGRTSLIKLSGGSTVEIVREKAVLLNSFNKKSPQRRFLRGKVQNEGEIQKVSITQVKSGNGILSSTLESNCLIELAAGNLGVNEGELVNIIKF